MITIPDYLLHKEDLIQSLLLKALKKTEDYKYSDYKFENEYYEALFKYVDEVMKKIRETVKEIRPKEKTIRITLDNIPSHIYRGIDLGEIRKQCSEAVHFEIKANVKKDGETRTSSTSKIDALTREFKQFVENQDISDKETLLELGIGYIEKIEAREEGK